MVTGSISEENAVACLRAGADDYLIKDRLNRLGQAVRHSLANRRLQEEKKAAEETLKERESRIQSIFRSAPIGIGVVSNRVLLKVNKRMCELTGYAEDELIGQSARMVYASEKEFKRVGKYKYEQIKKFGTGSIETQFLRKDGKLLDILLRSTPIDKHNLSMGITFTALDISESKQAHEQIAQAAQKWTTTFDSIQDGILLLSADQTVQQANQAFADLVKKPFAAIIGKKCYELVHADRQPDPNCPFARSSKSKKREFMELEINGRIFRIVTDPLKQNSGTFSGAVHIMTDITELKRVEQTLRKSEQRLRRFYESGMLGVIYWNMDGLIMDANDKFLELVGYTRDDLKRGKIDWIHMTPPEYQHLDANSVKELKATGVNKKPFEKEYIRKNGTRIPILLAGAMLDEDRFNGVAFVLDITERKKAEEDILKLSAVVEQSTEGMATRRLRWHSLLCQRGMVQNARLQKPQGAYWQESCHFPQSRTNRE